MRIYYAVIFLFCVSIQACHAGPWPQNPGRGLLISRTEAYETSGVDPDGGSREFEQASTGLYGEYGLTQRITLGGNLIYADQDILFDGTFEQAEGISVAEIFAQYSLQYRDYSALSVKVTYGDDTSIIRNRGLSLTTDERSAYIELVAAYGRNLTPSGRHFVTVEGGWRQSLGIDTDFYVFDISYGFKPLPKWTFYIKGYNDYSADSAGVGGNDYDVSRAEVSIALDVGIIGLVEVGIGQDITTENLDKGDTLFFNLWNEF